MRGANSEGRRTAKGMVVESRRAAMRGASSGGGTEMMRSMSGAGAERWVIECVSMGLVGRRQAWICWAMR